MTETMSALVYEAPREMVLREVHIPSIADDEVLIEVAYAGICGSELSGFLGQSSIRTPPLVFGHELSGRIVRVGSAVHSLSPGARVTVNPLITCGACRYCTSGRQQLCSGRRLLGASLPGANAQYVAVVATAVTVLPDNADLQTAAMVEPAAFAVHAVRLAGVNPGDRVLVIGAGAIGLFLIQVLRVWGVSAIFVSERNPDRLAMAVDCGATAIDDPVSAHAAGQLPAVDLAIDAVGTAGTRQACVAVAAPGGQVLLAGLHTDATELPLNTVVRGELVIRGAFAYGPNDFATALDWLLEGRIGLRTGVVEAPLVDGQAWYEKLVDGHPASKVLLRPGGAL